MKLQTALFLATLGLSSACQLLPGNEEQPANGSDTQRSDAPPPAPRSAAAPGWVTQPGSHPRYPRSNFMTATGNAQILDGDLGAAQENAMTNGMAQISRELFSDLKGETELYMQEVAVNENYSSVTDYTEQIRVKTESLLFGAKSGDSFTDTGSNSLYVLVVLDRKKHGEALLKKIRTELAKASGEADQATASGKLQALIKEHVILENVMPSILTLAIALPTNLPIRAEFDTEYENVKSRMRKIITELNDQEVAVRAVSGGGQRGVTNGALPEPIVFEATAGGTPLVGFPVRFVLEHPEQAELVAVSSATDGSGRFSCQVVGLKLTGDQENEVTGMLDYASFKEYVWRAPSKGVYYELPTLETATFAIAIEETNIDQVLPESGVRKALAEALNERGAKVIDLSAVLSRSDADKAATAGTDWIQSKLAGQVDYLIRGTARSRPGAKNRFNLNFAYAGGRVEMLDVRSGEQATSHEVQPSSNAIKESGSTQGDAGTKALKEFGVQVSRVLMKKIDGVFQIG